MSADLETRIKEAEANLLTAQMEVTICTRLYREAKVAVDAANERRLLAQNIVIALMKQAVAAAESSAPR